MTRPDRLPAIQLLLSYLQEEGVGHIFGIPGGPLMPLYEAMALRGSPRHVISKHEEGGAFMADGYARVKGGLGVCCATTGPGATNALTGVACSSLDSVPVLLITAQVALHAFGKGAAQESSPQGLDVVRLFKPVTKASLMLHAAEKMGETCRSLLRSAMTGRQGPVHLSIPADLAKRLVPAESPSSARYRPASRAFDREAVRRACAALAAAKRPAILAGTGVLRARAWGELRALAERLGAPVASTPKAKGVFPEDHPLSLGVLGFAGSPQADACFLSGDVDVLLAVGTSLGELATHAWSERLRPSGAFIQVDVDPSEIGKNYPVDVGIAGDAGAVLLESAYQLERELKRGGGPAAAEREAWVRSLRAAHPRTVRPEGFEDRSVPLKPQRLMRELERALPRGSHLFVDIGNVMAWALHFLTVREPGTFHINLGLASMGHAVAAAIGGKLAAPDRPVVALVGDAAFAMNGTEVHAAAELGLNVVWLVLNNGGHGMVTHGERLQFKGTVSTGRFRVPLDVAAIARGLGARAVRIDRPDALAGALSDALSGEGPAVIEAMVDPEEMPPLSLRIETLDRFFAGEKTEVAA
jgi:acetolactate synthase-1/2/3 large subunit